MSIFLCGKNKANKEGAEIVMAVTNIIQRLKIRIYFLPLSVVTALLGLARGDVGAEGGGEAIEKR